MPKVLIIGAGKSSSYLIDYMLQQAAAQQWTITVADSQIAAAEARVQSHPYGVAIALEVGNHEEMDKQIANHHLVISMLPAHMHLPVAKCCLAHGKHLVTASYISDAMMQLNDEAAAKQLVFMNECGLDPGIDHMSAMEIIHREQQKGHTITSFESYCGGLVAPESNNNPWGYKFSWNPRNVILAGQSTAQYLKNGINKYLPYHRLFGESCEIAIPGLGHFDGYANRDSLAYRNLYGLTAIETMLRGTLRYSGFCEAWHLLVLAGYTDNSYTLQLRKQTTYAQLLDSFLAGTGDLMKRLETLMPGSQASVAKLQWAGLLSNELIPLESATPAEVLQHRLEQCWLLEPNDRDMIVMWHRFVVHTPEGKKKIESTLVVKGENQTYTAMAKTVGLPVAMAATAILKGIIKTFGVVAPVNAPVYEPLLKELALHQIIFTENISPA